VGWKWTARLDAAGSVEARIPALDPQMALLVAKRIMRAKGQYYSGAVLSDFGAGVIDSIATSAEGQNGTITAGGYDLLYELTTKLVGDLLLSNGSGGAQSAGTLLASVMTNAPAGWTTTGTPSRAVYQQFKGETILAALSKLAEQTGDHFRLGSGRQIVWIPAGTFTASGVRAENAGAPIALEGNTAICSILSVTETSVTYDVFSRIYPYGSGSGDARLTIAGIDTTGRPPAGYTHNIATAPYYIEKTATTSTYGLIEREAEFNDIGAAETTAGGAAAHNQSAANALYDAALRKLALAANPQRAYKVEIAGLAQALSPGTTIRVVFRGYALDDNGNPLRWLNLNTDLFILSVTHEFDGHGLRKSTLEVTATATDQWPKNEASEALAVKDAVKALSQYRQGSATVTGVAVASGKLLTVSNSLTLAGTDGKVLTLTGSLTVSADTTISGGGTLALGGFTLTVPATGTAALRGVANTFTANQTITGNLTTSGGTVANDNSTNLLKVTGTMPTTPTAFVQGVLFDITSAGSAGQVNHGARVAYNAGYTGASTTAALSVANSAAGTAGLIVKSGTPDGNAGMIYSALGTTTGYNYGVAGFARVGDVSVGGVFRAGFTTASSNKNGAKYIGAIGIARNDTASGSVSIGGYFGLNPSDPTFENGALIADNSDAAYPILLGRDNGTTVFSVQDGGSTVIGSAAVATGATGPFLYITSCAGTPTGTPTGYTGRTAIVYDTTNNKFWAYNGSWRGVVLT
jgi:hypothetical protein